jgi:serine/threonine protein kinase
LISAIEHLHSLGHLHCDIKPDNLLYDLEKGTDSEDVQVYLIDFGQVEEFEKLDIGSGKNLHRPNQ